MAIPHASSWPEAFPVLEGTVVSLGVPGRRRILGVLSADHSCVPRHVCISSPPRVPAC